MARRTRATSPTSVHRSAIMGISPPCRVHLDSSGAGRPGGREGELALALRSGLGLLLGTEGSLGRDVISAAHHLWLWTELNFYAWNSRS
jgi:hypothetical protein